ncbi:MAG: response regulator [Acidobacteriota bacterium]
MMRRLLRVLFVDDSEDRTLKLVPELQHGGYNPTYTRVGTLPTLTDALQNQQWDLIIADLPGLHLTTMAVLNLFKAAGLDLPFIIVSQHISAAEVATAMQAGVHDCLKYDDLTRFLPAIERELRAAAQRNECRLLEEKLQEHASLLVQARDAIYVYDLNNIIVFWNKSAERLYGWSSNEAIGKKVDQFLFKKGSFQYHEARKLLNNKGEWSGELHQMTREGREIIVESYWTLLRDDQQNPKSILTVNIDITEKKRLAAQFLRAQRLESIGTLAGGIAHDLNNVLAPILMAVQLLRRKFHDEQSQRLLNTLETSAERGADLVKQVLSFAKGGEGEPVIVQPKHLIQDIEKILNETLFKSIEIEASVAKDLLPVMGDATQLHQVLMNLCVNARDAMPAGGKLTVSAENTVLDEHYARMNREARPGRFVLIKVTDTGKGIPYEIIDKIFDPFFTTKEVGQGTGLGLSTTLAIVKSHGGFINVYSEVGKGTQFKIYLPAAESSQSKAETVPQSHLPAGAGELILVVDDEASIREITKATLEAYGYEVLTANDGAEAIAIYAENRNRIAAVITDMMMPYMDGPATIRAMQKLDPNVTIIAASGLVVNTHTQEATNPRVKAFLPKPYTAETLLEVLKSVISS